MDGIRREVARKRWALKNGYEMAANGKMLHREVCRKAHGPFPMRWVVHHIDFDKKNNAPENLIALPKELHHHIHEVMKRVRTKFDRQTIQGYLKPYLDVRGNPKKFAKRAPKVVYVEVEIPAATTLEPTPPRSISSLYR